jgi:hypothetical protein
MQGGLGAASPQKKLIFLVKYTMYVGLSPIPGNMIKTTVTSKFTYKFDVVSFTDCDIFMDTEALLTLLIVDSYGMNVAKIVKNDTCWVFMSFASEIYMSYRSIFYTITASFRTIDNNTTLMEITDLHVLPCYEYTVDGKNTHMEVTGALKYIKSGETDILGLGEQLKYYVYFLIGLKKEFGTSIGPAYNLEFGSLWSIYCTQTVIDSDSIEILERLDIGEIGTVVEQLVDRGRWSKVHSIVQKYKLYDQILFHLLEDDISIPEEYVINWYQYVQRNKKLMVRNRITEKLGIEILCKLRSHPPSRLRNSWTGN